MDIRVVAAGIAALGIGANVATKVIKFTPEQERILGWISLALICFGILGIAYGFYVGERPEGAKISGTQTMTDSPGGVQVQGDNNVINQGLRAWRITKTDEFVRALRAVGPAAVKLEEIKDRDAVSLYVQMYDLFIAAGWTANERSQIDGSSWFGVHVVVQDKSAVPPAAVELVKQLRANDIASVLREPEKPNPTAFEKVAFIVRIGYRPPSNNE
jgi:hypothetical protein